MNECLKAAKMLYDDGNYQEAFRLVSDITPNNLSGDNLELAKECTLLSALSAVHLINIANIQQEYNYKDVVISSCELFAKLEKDVKKFSEGISSVLECIYNHFYSLIDVYVNSISSFDDASAVNSFFQVTRSELNLQILLGASSVEGFELKSHNNNEKFKSHLSKMYFKRGKDLIDSLPWEAKASNGENVVMQYNANASFFDALYLSTFLIDFSIPDDDDDDFDKKTFLPRAKALINVYSIQLNSRVLANDRSFSISIEQGNNVREETFEKASSLAKRIQKYEPNYELPYLQRLAITPPAQQSDGGCYVATAVYGSYDCPQVWTLRRFRDYSLAKTWYGRAFIRTYYAISPTVVKWFGHTTWFNKLWKGKLDSLVKKLQASGFSDTPYEDINW